MDDIPTPDGTLKALALTVVIAFASGAALASVFDVTVEPKPLSGLEWSPKTPVTAESAAEPFALRLVDAGGVGIPADTAAWGTSYSHATYAFDPLILKAAPWVDSVAFARVRSDWRRYVERMARYGNNAVVLDVFLELINFDEVGGAAVYAPDDPLRAQHRALRAAFGALVADARSAGMGVYLKTDMPNLTPELEARLAAGTGRLDTSDPAFWEVYADGIDELFRTMPDLDGVVIRVGEAGPLFNAAGSDYRSYMGVRTVAQLRTMLGTLLPAFERHGKRLIFRSWSVGVGELGHLHDDPAVYERALGGIDSPSLVVSTKFVAGDFFGFLPLNPTLAVGTQKRIVELQARREFEGFGALPNYLGAPHRSALQALRAGNPNLIGVSLWTQEGGPLRAGPLSLYTVAGFWDWTDASVYATSRLMLDPTRDPGRLAEEWARSEIADDPEVARRMGDLLTTSREALEKGFYIRPYATQRVRIVGMEAPPILWVFEWDVIGGWSSVSSILHHTIGDRAEEAIAEGFEAVRLTDRMTEDLTALAPRLSGRTDYPAMVRSLEYQRSLYTTLAWYRAALLHYYGWLDHGGSSPWREDARRFLAAAQDHEARFGRDLDFPAFDFAASRVAMARALDAGRIRSAARSLLAAVLFLLALGAPPRNRFARYPGRRFTHALWLAAMAPWLLARETADSRWLAWGTAAVVTAVTSLTVFLLLGSGSARVAIGVAVLLLTYAGVLRAIWHGVRHGGNAPASLGPLLLLAVPALAAVAVRGPDLFWLRFWTADVFRASALIVTIAIALWTVVAAHALGRRSGESRAFAAGSLLLATGCSLLMLTALLPDLAGSLAALDEPLHLLPMRPAILNGILHYAQAPQWVVWIPSLAGMLQIAGGFALRRKGLGAES